MNSSARGEVLSKKINQSKHILRLDYYRIKVANWEFKYPIRKLVLEMIVEDERKEIKFVEFPLLKSNIQIFKQ